jgi:hypothetical protein
MAKKHAPSKSSKRKIVSTAEQRAVTEVKHDATQSKVSTAAPSQQPKRAQIPVQSSARALAAPTPKATIPAEAALSFLRDTKGLLSWPLRELSHTLNISREEAEHVVALLQIQGYVRPKSHEKGEWITTPSGETVAGAKPPRFDRETVEAALTSLIRRIEDTNNDHAAKFKITRAVAFGDFLAKDRARVQAAEVGIELARKTRELPPEEINVLHSAVEAREEQNFLRQLRGRSALVNLRNYSKWMGSRTHQKLF